MSDEACTILDDSNVNEVPITNKEYQNILDIQEKILSLTAQDTQPQEILNALCKMAEALLPNSVASLMLRSEENGLMYVKAAPSIPDIGWQALNGIKPSPHAGSCANAVHYGKSQYIINTFEDERGLEFLDTAKAFNLCSCWSMPVKNEKGMTIGSYALSSFEHRSPAPYHKKLLEAASHIASIVLKNEASKKQIQKMIYYDALTGLKNKVSLQEELTTKVKRTLIFLDINNFSYVNTAYGFEIGDKILIRVAELLTELYPDNLYRINADQFAVKFDGEIDIEEAYLKIKLLFAKKTISVEDVKLKVSFTYGGVYSDKNLLKHAALALRKAKEISRNRLYIFDETLDSSQKRKAFIFMNTLIYTAFEENFITPFFQGIYDNKKKKITKYEALVRIQTDKGEVITPFKFLDVAKLSGLLPKLTRVMIDKTFAVMAHKEFSFSVNITEDDLSSYYLVDYLAQKIDQYKINPARVTLEILEGISASGQKNNLKQLRGLKDAGYQLAIDDFGAEYSNFERVLQLDVDILKIDARYIKNIDTDRKSYEIVKAIVGFASNMNIITIAEFVHSKAVQEKVEELGITYSQGYYFSEPTAKLETRPLNS